MTPTRFLRSLAQRLLRRWLAPCLLLVGACPAMAQPITLVHSGVSDYAPAFLARHAGVFAQNQLDVTLQWIPSSTTYAAGLMSKSFQIATLNPPAFLQAVDAGMDLVVVSGGGMVIKPDATYLGVVVRDGSGIQGAKDLVGKRVAVNALNGILHVMVRRWLTVSGVDPKKVIFVEGPLPQLGDLLKAGTADAIATIDPFMERLTLAGGVRVVSHLSDSMPAGIPNYLFVATREWATSHLDQVRAFRKSLHTAMEMINANPEKGREAIGAFVKLPPPVLAGTHIATYSPLAGESSMGPWVDLMNEQGMLRTRIDVNRLLVK